MITVLVFGSVPGGIFSSNDSPSFQVYYMLIYFNRLGNTIFMAFPIYFRTGRTWRNVLFFISITTGSVRVVSEVNPPGDANLAQS